jgi:tRNA A37 threonylcarbamoyladenosine synthetase subunit TsaC/SUA5/YrdC
MQCISIAHECTPHNNLSLSLQVVDFVSGKRKQRKSVGMRWPADPVLQHLLEELGGALLSHSVTLPSDEHEAGDADHVEASDAPVDGGALLEMYSSRGIDFFVDVGSRRVAPTSVVDMATGGPPEVVRVGRGDVSMFLAAAALP